MNKAILAPAAVLVVWSLVVLTVMAAKRLVAARALPADQMGGLPRVGGRGQDLDPRLGKAAWASHNYSHLMEQPTLFYATIAILALAGAVSETSVWLAWAYVALRVAHSLWQITINSIPVRFGIFLLSTVCLAVLAVRAVRATLFAV